MGAHGNGTMTVTTPSDTEIVLTRSFNAPRELVFDAHTSCEHMSKWWGPRKYETVTCDIDFRSGGTWKIVHRGPDGEEHGFSGEYREIVRPERIVWTFVWDGMPDQVGLQTLELEEHDGVTTLRAIATAGSKEERDGVLQSGMTEGAAETFDRLEEYLVELQQRKAS